MLVASLVVLAGMAVVLFAVYREPEPLAGLPVAAAWGVLPAPADVARASFPTVLRGYDPAAVDAHLQAAARAYADLLAAAPPEVVARARERAAVRLGWTAAVPPAAVPPPAEAPAPTWSGAGEGPEPRAAQEPHDGSAVPGDGLRDGAAPPVEGPRDGAAPPVAGPRARAPVDGPREGAAIAAGEAVGQGAEPATSVIPGSDSAATRGLPAGDEDALRAASVLGRLEDGAAR